MNAGRFFVTLKMEFISTERPSSLRTMYAKEQ